MSSEVASPSRRGNLVVLSAPSGAGKSSLVRRLLAHVDGIAFSVSLTTRSPRPGERDGVDYRFVGRAEFLERVGRGELLEHAEVHGNLYGTLRSDVEAELARGRDVLLEIDVQGARRVAAAGLGARLVFVLPPSREALEERIRGRGQDAEESIARRLADATGEVASVSLYEFVVVNDDLDRASAELAAVVRALRATPQALQPRLDAILATFGIGAGGRPGEAAKP